MATILVLEDEVPIAHAYQVVLEQAGYRVLVANDAKTGMELVKNQGPDLILMDVLMPEVNGLDMLKQLDLKKNFPQTKVIALSNIDTPKVQAEALKLGVVDYLRKVDYTPHQIVDLVQKHLAE